MKFLSLLIVFLLAKLAALWGHVDHMNAWTPIAYAWQDIAIALLFGLVDLALSKLRAGRWIVRALYGSLVVYIAVNVLVERVLASPLTRPMLAAARGPLSDSILLYVNATGIAIVAALLAAAAILPVLLKRIPRVCLAGTALAAMCIAALGPTASRHVDTHGMDRNVLVALFGNRLPAVSPAAKDWQVSGQLSTTDFSRYSSAARGWNVVMIGLESTAAQYLSLYGDPHESTPHLTELARNALVFDNAYAVYPESIKGLFSVLCSSYPAFDTQPEVYENVPCASIASVLAGAGYATALFHSGRFAYLGMNSVIRNRGYQTLEDAGSISGNFHSSFGVDEPATVSRALAWIDQLPHNQKFFLTWLPIAGHHPYASPDAGPFPGDADIDQYRNALYYGDRSLSALAAGLRARGLADRTLWIIYGDHGEAFGQHPGNFGHTFFLYEENVHVPLLVAAPGLFQTQQRTSDVVSLIDTAPTILDLLGLPAQAGYQGRSILSGAARPALFFADYSLGLLGLRDGRWKYVYEIGANRNRLFDLRGDPTEHVDLSSGNSARTAAYSRIVREWANEQETRVALRR